MNVVVCRCRRNNIDLKWNLKKNENKTKRIEKQSKVTMPIWKRNGRIAITINLKKKKQPTNQNMNICKATIEFRVVEICVTVSDSVYLEEVN